MQNNYDLAVIGSGPAGCSATLYASRAGLKVVMITGNAPGGQLMKTYDVENYPGLMDTNGPDMMQGMMKHALMFGAEQHQVAIKSINDNKSGNDKNGNDTYDMRFTLNTVSENICARSIIIATGSQPRKLNIIGEDEYYGQGVSYCAVCDGFFFKGKNVVVVGGGNSAVESAIYLARIAQTVTLIHRRDVLKSEDILSKRLYQHDNIKFIWNTSVQEIIGDKKANSAKLSNGDNINFDGIFINIGHIPMTAFLEGSELETTASGHIKTHDLVYTNIDGIFAAGDVADDKYMQAVTSAGFGCIAALEVDKYLKNI